MYSAVALAVWIAACVVVVLFLAGADDHDDDY